MNKKMIVLLMALSMVIGAMVTLTVVGVSVDVPTTTEANTTKQKAPVLEHVEYVGVVNKSCHHMACSGYLKFKDGDNIYQLKGHKHEIDTLVKGSYYHVYYDDFSKAITRYEFAKK